MSYKIHSLSGVTGGQMMSYIITTPGCSTYVIDGGYDRDAEELLRYIKENIGTRHIDGWFLTHPHQDHIHAFLTIIEKYAEEIDIDRIFYHPSDPEFIKAHQYSEDEYLTSVRLINDAAGIMPEKWIVANTGDRLELPDITVDVLYHPDPLLYMNVVNNASTVFKFTLGKKTLLITGDIGVEGSRICLAHYARELKCDIVEMSHHGQNGAAKEFYQAVHPTVCLWPTPQWLWDNNAGGGYDSHIWKTITVRGWMSELGVRRHIVAKDGNQILDVDSL